VIYTAVDVSLPLVITARQRVSDLVADSHGVICDLEAAEDLDKCLLKSAASKRIITFFGMLPNSESNIILPRLRKLADPGDLLLMSANLAPGRDYAAAVQRVLPQYDNRHTADWLMTLLYDLGVERSDGQLAFSIEECQGLRRIRADFRFSRACSIGLEDETVEFKSGDAVRLFFSYRYTPGLLATQLSKYSFAIEQSWIAPSGEEGVFIVRGA
ncbi:MAG: L-histidine N(alpha)-methyltransferase, partial [Verrucomicrobia subdivision 3 bacterium]|nr:L-histidine N(alpha)-methyltransferase [Limisphaerales bacterium]